MFVVCHFAWFDFIIIKFLSSDEKLAQWPHGHIKRPKKVANWLTGQLSDRQTVHAVANYLPSRCEYIHMCARLCEWRMNVSGNAWAGKERVNWRGKGEGAQERSANALCNPWEWADETETKSAQTANAINVQGKRVWIPKGSQQIWLVAFYFHGNAPQAALWHLRVLLPLPLVLLLLRLHHRHQHQPAALGEMQRAADNRPTGLAHLDLGAPFGGCRLKRSCKQVNWFKWLWKCGQFAASVGLLPRRSPRCGNSNIVNTLSRLKKRLHKLCSWSRVTHTPFFAFYLFLFFLQFCILISIFFLL